MGCLPPKDYSNIILFAGMSRGVQRRPWSGLGHPLDTFTKK